jgi:hypothetical protein
MTGKAIRRFAACAALALFAASPAPGVAGESPFGWIYTTDIHPKGRMEFEQWVELQRGQSQGQYSNLRLREEFEFGITERYQTSVYLNSRHVNAFRNGVDGTTGGPDVDPPAGFDPQSRYRKFRVESGSWENIYQLLNPLTDPIGLAIYLEPELGERVRELEARLIVQKNFLDDRLIWATNVNFVVEREKSLQGEIEKATQLDLLTGVSYRFRNNWMAGVELRNHREFLGYGFGSPEHSAWFVGPNLHYARQNWWITAAWRTQLPVVSAFNDEQRSVVVGHRIYGEEHARNEFMIKIGVPF